jgi:hypothetical protein
MAPIRETCFSFCAFQILLRANPEEKISVLGFSPDTARNIFRIFNTFKASNYTELIEHLSSSEKDEIFRIFNSISQEKLNYFVMK